MTAKIIQNFRSLAFSHAGYYSKLQLASYGHVLQVKMNFKDKKQMAGRSKPGKPHTAWSSRQAGGAEPCCAMHTAHRAVCVCVCGGSTLRASIRQLRGHDSSRSTGKHAAGSLLERTYEHILQGKHRGDEH